MRLNEIYSLPLYWEMSSSEKLALFSLLKDVNPSISIEIGTKQGGSLQLISALSEKVYSLDIDPTVTALSSEFTNVEFVIGDSKRTLPELLNQLAGKGLQPDFILVDGDHSAEGVKSDVENILRMNFLKPLLILMHDSFNPECRKGMVQANYSLNPDIEYVNLDFVQGTYSPTYLTKNEMWGGFGLIRLNPHKSKDDFQIQTDKYSFESLYKLSKHFWLSQKGLINRVKYFIIRKFFFH